MDYDIKNDYLTIRYLNIYHLLYVGYCSLGYIDIDIKSTVEQLHCNVYLYRYFRVIHIASIRMQGRSWVLIVCTHHEGLGVYTRRIIFRLDAKWCVLGS